MINAKPTKRDKEVAEAVMGAKWIVVDRNGIQIHWKNGLNLIRLTRLNIRRCWIRHMGDIGRIINKSLYYGTSVKEEAYFTLNSAKQFFNNKAVNDLADKITAFLARSAGKLGEVRVQRGEFELLL